MTTINIFWNWFLDNLSEISNLPNAPGDRQSMQLYWINKHLKSYCDLIDFVLVFPQNMSKPRLVFTTSNENAKQQAITLLVSLKAKIKWTILINDLTASKSSGFVVIQEPLLSCDRPNLTHRPIMREKHLKLHLPNMHVFCHYKHLGHISQLTDTQFKIENPNTFVQIARNVQVPKWPVELYQYQFLIDETNRINTINVHSSGTI
jgi:hypothetical protein